MRHYNEPLHLSSPAADAPSADPVRLAAAAYLARFTGSSREHTESDLRCYLRCALAAALTPWLTPHLHGLGHRTRRRPALRGLPEGRPAADAAEQSVRQSFENAAELAIDHHTEAVTNLIATWSINSARDMAWNNCLLLWAVRVDPLPRGLFLDTLAASTALASRMLLVAI